MTRTRWRQTTLDAFALIIILLSGFIFMAGLEQVIDIQLYDESGYLYAGVNLAEKGLMPPAWAPLYGVWYYALSFFTGDNISLYYLNYRVLTILPVLLLYLVLRAYRLSRWVALPTAWFLLIAMANVPTWPKPSHFALVLLLLFFLLGRNQVSPTRSTLFMAVGALLCSYVRPEFFLTFVLLLGFYLFALWRKRRQVRPFDEFVTAAGTCLICFALIGLFDLAILDTRNDRSFEAFAQHFAINWNTWNEPDVDPWVDYNQAIHASFGTADTVSAALHSNPSIFIRHMLTNIVHGPVVLFQLFFLHYNILLPAIPTWTTHIEGYLLLGLLVAALVISARSWRPGCYDRLRQHQLFLVYGALFMLPGALSAVLVYPRNHYLLIPGVLITIAGALLFTRPASEPTRLATRSGLWPLAVTGMLLLLLTPTIADAGTSAPLNNVRTIRFIRSLPIGQNDQPVNLLEAEGGYYIYLGNHFHRIPHYRKDHVFTTFVDRYDIDMIVVSAELRTDPRYQDDPQWHAFLADPSRAGYTALDIPGTDRALMVKTTWLTQSSSIASPQTMRAGPYPDATLDQSISGQ